MRAPRDEVSRRRERLHRLEILPVNAPKHAVAEGPHAGASGGVIQERELSHPVTHPNGAHRLVYGVGVSFQPSIQNVYW